MADNKTYYYLKLKEDFFNSEDMKLLQGLQDGYLYSDILLKLCLLSLKQNGKLMYRGVIPYTPEMVSAVTNHQVGTVEKAIHTLQSMGFIEILDNGAIFMTDIQNFIGQSTTEADRKRKYRNEINAEKLTILESQVGQMSDICPDICPESSDKCTPEYRDKSIEIRDKSLENRDKNNSTVSNDTVSRTDVQRVVTAWNQLGLSQVQSCTADSKRGQMLNARIRKHGIEKVLEAVNEISMSSFLQGQNQRGWTISFEWFVKPNNFVKVMEGQYRDKKPGQHTSGNAYIDAINNRVSDVDNWGRDLEDETWNS